MDQIQIKGLRIFAFHGINPEEKQKGQPFILDVTMHTTLAPAGQSDDLADTVNYAAAVKVITAAMTETFFNLIEAAARQVADRLLLAFDKVAQVDVTVKKPYAPITADFEYVAVSISRGRNNGQ